MEHSLTIQRLNMDNSWLIEISGVRILVDPWLIGAEVDFFPWFNKQWHRTKPIDLEQVNSYDFILITQKYPDHFHLETLKQLKPTRLISPKSINRTLTKHFPEAEILNFDDEITSAFGLGINIHMLPTKRRIDPIYDALIIEDGKESIFLASHGYTDIDRWEELISTFPPCKLVFTPFNEYRLPVLLGGTVSPGLSAVKSLVKVLDPNFLVATHDEDKYASGFVSKLARIALPPSIEELNKDADFKGRVLDLNDYKEYQL